jgi:hypothetical protein
LDEQGYEDSSQLPAGDESNQTQQPLLGEGEGGEGGGEQVEAVAAPVAAAPVVPVVDDKPAVTQTAQPVHPGTVSPFAQGLISDAERTELEQTFLPEQVNAIITLSSRIAQREVRAFEQQQDIATDLGVPAAYMRDVKAYSDRVPEGMRGSKEGAQAAILLAMHDRAAQGGNLIDEMERFVQAARPAPATPAKPAATPPEALAPAARVTRSNVSGTAVAAQRVNGTGKKDVVETKMPWLKNYLED